MSGGPYEVIGRGHAAGRHTDQRIAARIWAALGKARSVVNIGAGSGSYEPPGRNVVAVEPSAVMRAQRPPSAAPCLAAAAESLPFADRCFGAAMSVLSDHHWADPLACRSAGRRRCARDRPSRPAAQLLSVTPVRNRRGTGRGPDAGAFRALRAS